MGHCAGKALLGSLRLRIIKREMAKGQDNSGSENQTRSDERNNYLTVLQRKVWGRTDR